MNTGGKVVGFVVFDALLRTPLYFVGLSSGPFDNRNNPSTVDQYILNPLEDGYREIISWFGDGTSFVAETGVWVAREGAKFVVKRGGNVVGEIGADVSKLGKDLGDALPSLNLGNDSSAAAAPALTTRTETVTRDAPLPI
ncbi:MAG TPA: hypothetical protein PK765_06475 [bacterium]|nr:hypothetical protein [bacterium]